MIRRRLRNYLIAAVVGLCVVCGVIGWLASLGGDNNGLRNGTDGLVEATAIPTLTPVVTSTQTPTVTSTQTPTVTSTQTPMETPTLISLFSPIETPTLLAGPTETPTFTLVVTATGVAEVRPMVVVEGGNRVNLRGGPGLDYGVVGSLGPGEELGIVGRNGDSSWWQVTLAEGGLAWVSGEVVATRGVDVAVIPVVEWPATVAPTVTGAPTSTVAPTPVVATATTVPVATVTQGAAEPVCDCSGDLYNCTGEKAIGNPQACFEYCKSVGRGDVHGLDRDNDGLACER